MAVFAYSCTAEGAASAFPCAALPSSSIRASRGTRERCLCETNECFVRNRLAHVPRAARTKWRKAWEGLIPGGKPWMAAEIRGIALTLRWRCFGFKPSVNVSTTFSSPTTRRTSWLILDAHGRFCYPSKQNDKSMWASSPVNAHSLPYLVLDLGGVLGAGLAGLNLLLAIPPTVAVACVGLG